MAKTSLWVVQGLLPSVLEMLSSLLHPIPNKKVELVIVDLILHPPLEALVDCIGVLYSITHLLSPTAKEQCMRRLDSIKSNLN